MKVEWAVLNEFCYELIEGDIIKSYVCDEETITTHLMPDIIRYQAGKWYITCKFVLNVICQSVIMLHLLALTSRRPSGGGLSRARGNMTSPGNMAVLSGKGGAEELWALSWDAEMKAEVRDIDGGQSVLLIPLRQGAGWQGFSVKLFGMQVNVLIV